VAYEARLESVSAHPLPDWYQDAKLGIFVHWGPFAIPAYAPLPEGDINDLLRSRGARALFREQPYSEWYLNSLRIKGSTVRAYHERNYGAGSSYFEFAARFRELVRGWDPRPWCEAFAGSGARYMVFVAKHHEGFLMWPSGTPNYRIPDYDAGRDIVGELFASLRSAGMRAGVYYSSALDWSFTTKPIRDMADMVSIGGPSDERYARYQLAHWLELVERYEPSILWGDICFPPRSDLYGLFAAFYNKVGDGVVNDRWLRIPRWLSALARSPLGRGLTDRAVTKALAFGGSARPPHCDFITPEFRSFPDIRAEKWESCRGMAKGFGYNRTEGEGDYIELPALVRLLVDIVSKNGNLLLNVGPTAEGTIPEPQRRLLSGLGAWVRAQGEAIFGTRPWIRAEGRSACGVDLRFTKKGSTLYAILMGVPADRRVLLLDVPFPEGYRALDLASGKELRAQRRGADLEIDLPPLHEEPALSILGSDEGSVARAISVSPAR
jgi:alpha-L-fucosidase